MTELTLQKRYVFQTPEPRLCRIFLVGCGGTGSFLALHLARLVYHVRERTGQALPVTFVDPDTVEAKNIGRQNFAPAEVGRNKAAALAWRFNLAFGLSIQAVPAAFERALVGEAHDRRSNMHGWILMVGAVDNAAARRELAAAAGPRNRTTWLDCGNHEHAGQVLLGDRDNLEAPEISPLGFCSGLPLPTIQHPELLEAAPATASPASCADLALADVQSLMINQAMATYAAQYVYRLLVSQDLDVYATYVDLVSGSARSLGITDARER